MYPDHSQPEFGSICQLCWAYWLCRSHFGRSMWKSFSDLKSHTRLNRDQSCHHLLIWGSEHGAGVGGESPLKCMENSGFLCLACHICGNTCISDYENMCVCVCVTRGWDVFWQLTSVSWSCLALLTSCSALGKPVLRGEKSYLFSHPAFLQSFLKRNCQSCLIALNYVWQIGTEVLLALGRNESWKSELLYCNCRWGCKPHSSMIC